MIADNTATIMPTMNNAQLSGLMTPSAMIRNSRNCFCARALQFISEASCIKGFFRQAAQPHEINPGNGISFNELKCEKKYHSCKPRYIEKVPAPEILDKQPSA